MVVPLVVLGMSSRHNGRDVVMLCEECHSKMLAIGELLLVSCEPRPVFTTPFDLHLSKETFEHYRDKVIDKLNHILIGTRDVSSQVHSGSVQWKSLTAGVQELSCMVISLTELSAHIAYLIALNFPHTRPYKAGIVHKYRLHSAKLDLKFSCSRLKRSCVDDLDPHMIVELCSTISRALSSITEVCKQASESAPDAEDQNQFKLCVKSITSTTSCLVASLKRFRSSPGLSRLRRVIAFCDPVVSTSSALVTFASEDEFIGSPARLSDKAVEAHKSVLGMTMSIVSASIQMCKAVRDLVYDLNNARHRERIRLCVDSVDRASSKLRDLLLSCHLEPPIAAPLPAAPSPLSPNSLSLSSAQGQSDEGSVTASDLRETQPLPGADCSLAPSSGTETGSPLSELSSVSPDDSKTSFPSLTADAQTGLVMVMGNFPINPVDSKNGSGDGENAGLDPETVLLMRETGLVAVGNALASTSLGASSPVLNVSMTSVNSFSDVDHVSIVD